ncbi:PilZ domain-containing protein [Candidatus Sumerlaeota bacterium]|nr:PilZ domain-containing protein [Candidatus Sumerlaeota bacterium]
MPGRENTMELSDLLKRGQHVQLVNLPRGAEPFPKGQVETVGTRTVNVAFAPGEAGDARRILGREVSIKWESGGRSQECPVVLDRVDDDVCVFRLNAENRREYLRVPVHLTLIHEPIEADAIQAYINHVLSQPSSQSEPDTDIAHIMRTEEIEDILEDQFDQMTQALNKISSKLDYLISLAEGKKPEVTRARSAVVLDLSGSGLSFVDSAPVEPESYLKIRLQISRFPLLEVRALTKVVRCDPVPHATEGQRYEVGVFFEAIHEDDREKIFRFIVKVERKILRERKELMTSS